MADREYEYKITADIAQFRSAMQESAAVSRQSAQQVSDAFRNVQGGLGSLTAGLGNLRNLLAGAFSVGAVVNFGRAIAASTLEAEQSTALLNATLRATGYAAGLSSGDVEQLVAELQKVSQFDDDPLRQGVTALLRFREISGDTFREASRLAVDLAVATGRDLPSAFTAIGKSLQDPVGGMKALREAGVQLSEGQQELADKLLKTGDVAGAQKIVLDELRASVGGAGGTASEGLTGTTRSLANAWDNLLTTIGRLPSVANASRSSLQSLTLALETANRLLSDPESPLSGSIRVPGVSAPAAPIGRLSEAEALALQQAPGPRVQIAGPRATDKEAEAAARRLAAEKKRLAAEKKRLAEELFRDELAFNKAESDAEKRELERVADERQRLEDEIAQANAERVAQLLGETKGGQQDKLAKDLALLNAQFDEGVISAKQLSEAYGVLRDRANEIDGLKKVTEDTDKQAESFKRLEAAVKGWGNAFNEEIVQSLRTGQLNVARLVDMMLTDLARLVVYKNITEPLFTKFGQFLGSTPASGKITPAPVPGPAGTPFGYNFGGGRAAGGDVFGGNWYLVGERGPERLYVPPGASGTVMPNGGGGMTVVQNISVDARSDISSVRAAIFEATQLAQSMDQRAARRG